jgi:hypothetical protein
MLIKISYCFKPDIPDLKNHIDPFEEEILSLFSDLSFIGPPIPFCTGRRENK